MNTKKRIFYVSFGQTNNQCNKQEANIAHLINNCQNTLYIVKLRKKIDIALKDP